MDGNHNGWIEFSFKSDTMRPLTSATKRCHSSISLYLNPNIHLFYSFVADTASRSYYKSYPQMDFSQFQRSAAFQPISVPPKDKSYMHKTKSYMHQNLPPYDIHSPLSISIPTGRIPKTSTQPVLCSSGFRACDSGSRHIHRQTSHPGHSSRGQSYSNRRQYSIEMLPEFFKQPMTTETTSSYQFPPKYKSYHTNSKTEVTV